MEQGVERSAARIATGLTLGLGWNVMWDIVCAHHKGGGDRPGVIPGLSYFI